jgi:hypothetical protein
VYQEADELYTVAKMSVGAIKEELIARGINATGMNTWKCRGY